MSFTPKPRLHNKVCIITGSSSGLGRAIALGYARQGASVVCADLQKHARADVNRETSISTDELIALEDGNVLFIQTDVSQAGEVEALIARTVEEFGRTDV